MGLPGYIDNRWFERIGSALLLSIVLDEINLAQRERYGDTNDDDEEYSRTYSAAGNAVEQILSDNLNIKPTLYANQGARVSIYVARDVDFSSVYAIR
jgi:type IV secretion system protein VirB10